MQHNRSIYVRPVRTTRRPHAFFAFALLAASTLAIAPTLCVAWTASSSADTPPQPADAASAATILVYHRFGPAAVDGMTTTKAVFAWQLEYMRGHGYTIVPLRDVVYFAAGHGRLPTRAVAITVDDGHRSVFTEMKPLIERYRLPVTLFIYPSAISNASYAMTWEQLRALEQSGLFDIQSHTWWHPNFKRERRRLTPAAFGEFVRMQLTKPRILLKQHLGVDTHMIAWPFGIYDDELIRIARECGYTAGFTLDRRPVTAGANVMALARYLVADELKGKSFESVLQESAAPRAKLR